MPEFVVRLSPAEVNHVSIPPQDAERLIQNLERGPHVSAAAKIRSATKLAAESTLVELTIGEDEAVTEALNALRTEGELGRNLDRLEQALRAKIDREN